LTSCSAFLAELRHLESDLAVTVDAARDVTSIWTVKKIEANKSVDQDSNLLNN
jgi:hypothetical protein